MPDNSVALAGALYGPLYAIQGVDAVITLADGSVSFGIRALDKTKGATVPFRSAHRTNTFPLDVDTVRPIARIRMTELDAKGYRPAQIARGTITLNGLTWRIKSALPSPGPLGGEAVGETILTLGNEPESA